MHCLLIFVVSDEQGLSAGRSSGSTAVLTHGGLTVGLGALHELSLTLGDVLLLAGPRLEHGGLQGAAVAEGECPGFPAGVFVDGVQIHGGLLLRLTTRQEGDA